MRVESQSPGDGTGTRFSALGDERVGGPYRPFLSAAADWSLVYFVHDDHIGLTRNATFTDNLLWLLIEKPRQRLRSERATAGASGS